MPRVLQILFSRCTDADREVEFNRWSTHTHLPDLSRAPGFVGCGYRGLTRVRARFAKWAGR
jgi:hypothetical protein